MPRIRTVKPEFFADEKLSKLKRDCRLLYIGLWVFGDDYGTVRSNPVWIKSNVFPYDEELRVADVITWLDALVKARMLEPFQYNGEGFYNIRTFDAHQRVDKPSKPIVPLEEKSRILVEYSTSTRGALGEYSTPEVVRSKGHSKEEVGNSKGEGPPAATTPAPAGKEKRKRRENFVPPSREEVQAFFLEKTGKTWGESKARLQADTCFDHYTGNGWVQGKGKPIVDWQAAARNWMRREASGEFSSNGSGKSHPPPVNHAPPVQTKPVEIQKTPEQKADDTRQYVEVIYADYLAGTLNKEFVFPEAYDTLKAAGLMKLPQSTTERIMKEAREKRIAELRSSTVPADRVLLAGYADPPDDEQRQKDLTVFTRIAKRLAILEFFKTQKEHNATHIFEAKV